jgi:hypothetical protein
VRLCYSAFSFSFLTSAALLTTLSPFLIVTHRELHTSTLRGVYSLCFPCCSEHHPLSVLYLVLPFAALKQR